MWKSRSQESEVWSQNGRLTAGKLRNDRSQTGKFESSKIKEETDGEVREFESSKILKLEWKTVGKF